MTLPESPFAAESALPPGWIAIRLCSPGRPPSTDTCPPRSSWTTGPSLGFGSFWAWMLPPESSEPLRAALGPLAWGRLPWQDMLAEAIAHGLRAEFIDARRSDDASARLAAQLIKVDSGDGSRPPEYTPHSFDPLTGRPPSSVKAIAWATLAIDPKQAASQGILAHAIAAEISSLLFSAHPTAVAFGPLPEHQHTRSRFQAGDGAGLAELASEAFSLLEAAALHGAASDAPSRPADTL